MADRETEVAGDDGDGDGDGDGLYVVAPEQFIAARDARARRLRSGGHKAEAAQVAKRRRPPLTAWALNQVARTNPPLIEALLVAGGQLRAATEEALTGDASGLRPARTAQRSAVDAVVADAVGCLEQGGYLVTDVMRLRMAATLRAAVVDESVADHLRRGVLEGDRDAPGFGMDAMSPAARPPPDPVSPAPVPEPGPPTQDTTPGDSEEQARDAARAAMVQEQRDTQASATRRAAEAAELVAEADRLAAEASQAGERATEARARADAAVHAAAAAAQRADALIRE